MYFINYNLTEESSGVLHSGHPYTVVGREKSNLIDNTICCCTDRYRKGV